MNNRTDTTARNLPAGFQPETICADGQSTYRGFPVWKLNGVTERNVEFVKKTDHWIHYGKLGYDGYGLVANRTLDPKTLVEFRRLGIAAQPWINVPKNSALLGFLCVCGVFATGLLTSEGYFLAGGGMAILIMIYLWRRITTFFAFKKSPTFDRYKIVATDEQSVEDATEKESKGAKKSLIKWGPPPDDNSSIQARVGMRAYCRWGEDWY